VTMPAFEKDVLNLETLYLELESRLDSQYQDLLAQRFPDSAAEAETANLERRLLEAEKLLSRNSSFGNTASLVPETGCVLTAADADSLRRQAQHLLELVRRNAAKCIQLQNSARCGLEELQRGERFLQGVRGYRENQPRFFDSCR
jgi:hypothetical protein